VRYRTFPTLVVAFLGILFGTTLSNSQDTVPSPESQNAALPNAPSVTETTTCTERNGKACPEWVHKLIGQYPRGAETGDWQPIRDPSSVHFWTYRGWQEPPLRSNKEVFRSKVFLATHIGGAIALIVACRNKRSREHWDSEVPAVGAVFALDYLQFRFIGGPNAVAPAIYEMIHYGIASTR